MLFLLTFLKFSIFILYLSGESSFQGGTTYKMKIYNYNSYTYLHTHSCTHIQTNVGFRFKALHLMDTERLKAAFPHSVLYLGVFTMIQVEI